MIKWDNKLLKNIDCEQSTASSNVYYTTLINKQLMCLSCAEMKVGSGLHQQWASEMFFIRMSCWVISKTESVENIMTFVVTSLCTKYIYLSQTRHVWWSLPYSTLNLNSHRMRSYELIMFLKTTGLHISIWAIYKTETWSLDNSKKSVAWVTRSCTSVTGFQRICRSLSKTVGTCCQQNKNFPQVK